MTLRKSAQNVFKLVTRLMETTILVLEKVLLSAGVMSLMIGLREEDCVWDICGPSAYNREFQSMGAVLDRRLTLC